MGELCWWAELQALGREDEVERGVWRILSMWRYWIRGWRFGIGGEGRILG
jgi:hypothetical protein